MFKRPMDFEMNSNTNITGNNNVVDNDMNVDINMMQNSDMGNTMSGGCCNPISEAPQVRCVHRTIVHEVPHV